MGLVKIYRNVKIKQWIILLAFWTFIAAMITSQLFFNSIKNGNEPSWINLFIAQLPIWYFWTLISPTILYVVNKYPFDLDKWIKSILVYTVSGIVILLVISNLTLVYMFSVYGYIDLTDTTFEEYSPYFFSRLTNDLLIYGLVVMIIVVVRSYTIRKNNQLNMALMMLKNDQLKNQLTQSQLQALKLQLNPHFLFNTLNTISSLTLLGENNISINVTTKLGDFLRRTLDYEDHQLVTPEKELEFFDLYLEIESIRFKDRLELKREIDPHCMMCKVPNLILQPLIENAIKHGLSKSKYARLIELKISQENESLLMTLFSEGPALSDGFMANEGIGLNNVKHRLEKLYDGNYFFELKNEPLRNGVKSVLRLPINVIWNTDDN